MKQPIELSVLYRAALVGLLLALSPLPLTAQEAPAVDSQEAPPEKEKTAAERGENPEVFVPTEEISEDFAVSFPVDI